MLRATDCCWLKAKLQYDRAISIRAAKPKGERMSKLRMSSILIAVFVALASVNCRRQQCGRYCGTERWAVKTLSDPDSERVDPALKEETVSALRGLPRPAGHLERRRDGVETTTFRVKARLVGYKNEDDGDFHVLIADLDHSDETMIVEIPNVECAGVCASGHIDDFKTAASNVVNLLGSASLDPRAHLLGGTRKIIVEVVGVGFFDFEHHQNGRAPNNLELHPVLSINEVQEQSKAVR